MMKLKFLPIETILSKFNRDIRSKDASEADIIAWTGEALDFIKIPELQELTVSFEPVINYDVILPTGFQKIQQIARYNRDFKSVCVKSEQPEEISIVPPVPVPDPCAEPKCYQPYFDMQWQIVDWANTPDYFKLELIDFTPVRLANSNFFGTMVCEEIPIVRDNCRDEYTLIGTQEKRLRFSFKEGWVLIAFYKNILASDGMPLIPDNIQLITAITYYIQWKIAESLAWNGREGFSKIAQEKNIMWERYIRRAKSGIKMLDTIDEYQDIMEQSLKPNINFNSYNNFFNNLAKNKNL